MCGRYTLTQPAEVLAEAFDVSDYVELQPRYNIAPTQDVAVIGRNHEGRRTLGLMRWGLIPSWAKDPTIGNRMINARGESAAEKPAFRSSFKSRRCLVPADGFYEWKKQGSGSKQPYYIRMKDHHPFAFAGLWSRWRPKATDGADAGEPILSCTLLTTSPNPLMAEIHDRMPVILHPEHYDFWLNPDNQDAEALNRLLVPYEPEAMEAYPISTMVNRPGNEGPRLIEPLT